MGIYRTWAEISLSNIRHNCKEIRRLVGDGTLIMAVVKADGYGHGAVRVSQAMAEAGVDRFAVATVGEAVALRCAGISSPIMVLGGTSPELTGLLIEHDIIQSVFCLDVAREFAKSAASMNSVLKIHIKVDTGMSRLGFVSGINSEFENALEVCSLKGLEVEGIFTHFTSSENPDDTFYLDQLGKFKHFVSRLEACGIQIPIKHSANSGAIINHRETHMDMVRPGIALYGLYPGQGLDTRVNLKPAMQLRATVAQIHEFEQPVTISYGRTYRSASSAKFATVTIGYADGYPRSLSGKAEMLVHGDRVRQTGSICMDMCVVDISKIDGVKAGDLVTVFGCDGKEEITIDEIARKCSTIPYEIICALSPRVERIYTE